MFVRKKRNKSGTISVQIIDKSAGYKVIETIGSSKNADEIANLVKKAEHQIRTNKGRQRELFRNLTAVDLEEYITGIVNTQVQTIGPELILGSLFDKIGFNVIKDDLFRHLVITRLVYPVSKLKTVDYLYRYQGTVVDVATIYRFLDKLHSTYKATVEKIAFEYTKGVLKDITVVFYDMTTLYFESEDEDDLRKIGFSKDGKFRNPQIMLGLLVGQNGYPIGYDIFEGNVFEGKTLLPTLAKIKEKFGFGNPVVIADAAMLSKQNMNELRENGYQFIIGGRIKNESAATKREIIEKAETIKNQEIMPFKRQDGSRLIVSYSSSRHKKDQYNRERGLKKLRQGIKSGKLKKKHINNRGYNKFLKLTGTVEVEVDEAKVEADSFWDGLKGYVTNTELPGNQVIDNYRHLWQIEKAFRISKTDLRIRPIHHYRQRRIEAHICIAFVAYTIYKELERLLGENKTEMSPKRALELTQNMYAIECQMPDEVEKKRLMLKMDPEQQVLYDSVLKHCEG
jgi:transposase